eukprot:5623405-Pyramimonas_sp.AAC.1
MQPRGASTCMRHEAVQPGASVLNVAQRQLGFTEPSTSSSAFQRSSKMSVPKGRPHEANRFSSVTRNGDANADWRSDAANAR